MNAGAGAAAEEASVARPDSPSFDLRLLLVGLIAGMALGMVEMVIEAVVGTGFWAPLRFVASALTPGKDTDPSFAPVPVVVGFMGHMMNAVNLGLLFVFVISRITNNPARLLWPGCCRRRLFSSSCGT